MTRKEGSARPRWLATVLLAALAALALAACGGEDPEPVSGGKSAPGGDPKEVEEAFLTGMVHHHESALAMAKIAKERANAPFIKALADDISSTQEREIEEMRTIYRRLTGGQLEPDPTAHEALGLSAEEAGMTHGPETNKMLRKADPFDRAFVDDMVPHHSGAVKMAEVVLKETSDTELRKLAEAIVSAQEREIEEMNAFRTKEFGGPVPGHGGHGREKPAEEHGGGHSE